jgi:hypothetical protein
MRFMLVALLISVMFLSGCISEKAETGYTTEVSLDHSIFFKNITELDHYIVRLNTTTPVKTSISGNVFTIYPITNNPEQKTFLSMIVIDVGKGNETYSDLERITRKLISSYRWQDAKIYSASKSWYATLDQAEINGYSGILETGNPKYEPSEVIATYSPLTSTIVMVHSTFSKQETWDILNTTTITRSEVRT